MTLYNPATGQDVAISQEFSISVGTLAMRVTSPAAQAGFLYRVYAGRSSGAENLVAQAPSYPPNTIVFLATMAPGTPVVGTAALTRIFAYDLVQKNWTIVDLPFPISALKQIRTGGTQPLTICCGWSDAALRRLFAGDATWDGVSIEWSMEGGEIYQQGGSGKVFYRKVVVRGSSVNPISIEVAANIQGNAGAPLTAALKQLGPQQWDARLDIMMDGENANISISGAGQTTLDSVDWYVKPKPAGAPVSAQK